MKKYLLPAVFLFSGILFSLKGFAQDPVDSQQHEEIILRKDGTFPQDLTIHIKGDKITINGKVPDDIDVIRKKSKGSHARTFEKFHRSGPLSPGSFGPSFSFNSPFSNNKSRALLGVLTLRDDSSGGAQIEEVEKGTAADSAGLQKGDVITAVNDHSISTPEDLSKAIQSFEPGDQVTIVYLRNGQSQQAKVTLGRMDNWGALQSMPAPFEKYMPPNGWSRWFQQHHPQINRDPNIRIRGRQGPRLGMMVENRSDEKGVTVIRVNPDSPAEKAGFKAGDIVTRFGGEEIDDIDDLREALHAGAGKKSVKATVQRNKKDRTLHVSLPEHQERANL